MAKISRQVGTTSQIVFVKAYDSSSTSGAAKTGLAYNTSGLTAYYKRSNGTGSVAITLANITTLGTFASGGFKEVDSTGMPGIYEFHIPNAALASGADNVVIVLTGASNMLQIELEIELTATSNQDGTAGGISRLDAAITSRMATFTLPTNFSSLSIDGSGKVTFVSGQIAVKKNVALSAFSFPMFDGSGNPRTGLTVTAQRSIDGAAFGSCANSAAEIANGWYKIDLAAADLNGNVIALRFSATGAQDNDVTIVTQP